MPLIFLGGNMPRKRTKYPDWFPKSSGVYKITCLINGKVYIGACGNFDERWVQHIYNLRLNAKRNGNLVTPENLQEDWNIHGESGFEFSVIEEFPYSEEFAKVREDFWIAEYNSLDEKYGYNRKTAGRDGSLTESSKRKISEANSGKLASAESKLKMRSSHQKRLSDPDERQKWIETCSQPGEKNGMAKLSNKDILTIWKLGLSAKDIRKQYNVGHSHSYKIAGRRTRLNLLKELEKVIEIFILKNSNSVFKYLLPDGRSIERVDGKTDLKPLNDFMDYEVKIVYFPSEEGVNDSSGEIEIKLFDTLKEAFDEKLLSNS